MPHDPGDEHRDRECPTYCRNGVLSAPGEWKAPCWVCHPIAWRAYQIQEAALSGFTAEARCMAQALVARLEVLG